MPGAAHQTFRDVTVKNREGLHARPIMRFVDLASTFCSSIVVTNLSGAREPVDGKSAMQMMLLEATQGSTLRIEARGEDAPAAVLALADLIEHQIGTDAQTPVPDETNDESLPSRTRQPHPDGTP